MTNAQILLKTTDWPSNEEMAKTREPSEQSVESRVNEMFPAVPQTSESGFGRAIQGVFRGIDNTVAGVGATGMALGSVLDNEWLKEFGEDVYINASRSATRNAARVGSFTNSKNVGDFIEYATEAIAENILNIPLIMAGGIGGGMAAARAATGSVGAALGRGVSKEAITGYLKGAIEKEGLEAVEKRIAKSIALGRVAGAYVPGYGLSAGEAGSELYSETQTPEGTQGALLAAIPMAAVEIIPELNTIARTLGKPAAKVIQETMFKRYGKSATKSFFEGGGEELVQGLMIDAAVYLEKPGTDRFTSLDFIPNKFDDIFKGGIGQAATAVAAQGLSDFLAPPKDPLEKSILNEVENIAKSKAKIPEPDAEDLEAANEASGDVSGSTLPTEGENKVSPLEEQKIIVTDKLASVDDQLDTLLNLEEPKTPEAKAQRQTKLDDLNEQRKQLQEELLTIQSTEQGYDPNKEGDYLQNREMGKLPEDIDPATVTKMSKEWMDEFSDTISLQRAKNEDPIGGGTRADIRAAYKKEIEPVAGKLAAAGVKTELLPIENDAEGKPTDDSIRPAVRFEDDGSIILQLPSPEQLRISKGEAIEDHLSQRLGPQIIEESDHITALMALRKQWQQETRNDPNASFNQFMSAKMGKFAESIRGMASNKTIRAFATGYTAGRRPTSFDIKPGMTPQQIEKVNSALANEFIRAVFRKMRDGTLTEETQALYALEKQGNVEAGSLLDQILQAIKVIKDALVNFINPKTAPKDIKELINRMNILEDQFVGRKKAPPAPATPASAPTSTDRFASPSGISFVAAQPGTAGKFRPMVFMKIGSSYLPFYRSSKGTSGKQSGKWYPFFGYGDGGWLIKLTKIDFGSGERSYEDGYGIPAIQEAQNFLNDNYNYDPELDRETDSGGMNPQNPLVQKFGQPATFKKSFQTIGLISDLSPRDAAKEIGDYVKSALERLGAYSAPTTPPAQQNAPQANAEQKMAAPEAEQQPAEPIIGDDKVIQSGEDLPRFIQYFEARDRNNEIAQDNIPITVNAESPEQAAEKATQTPKYQDLKKRYKGKVYSKGSPILARPQGVPGDLGMGTQDLRKMQSGEDLRYLELAKDPEANKEELQAMVDEAAKKAGYDSPKVYHGTQADFVAFDSSRIGGKNGRSEGAGFYFTTDQSVADGYQGSKGHLISAYLKITKLLDYNAKPFSLLQIKKLLKAVALTEARDSFAGEWKDGFLANYGDTYSRSIDSIVSEAAKYFMGEVSAIDQLGGIIGSGVAADTVNEALASSLGYDTYFSSGFSGEGKAGGDIYVATNPNQIKSADPVTYDENGNVIPLSKRFNPQSNNIMQSGEDMPKWERVIQDELIEPYFAKNQLNPTKSEKRKSKAKATYLGPNLVYDSRSQSEQYDKFHDLVRAVGPIEAFRMVGYDRLGTVDGDYKVIARAWVAGFLSDGGIRQVTEMIPKAREREAIQAELYDILTKLNTEGPRQGTEAGREVSAFKQAKRFMENGDTAFRALQNIIMDQVMKAESNWTPNEFAMILEHAREMMFKGVDKVVARKDFLARLSKLIREATKDPEKLVKNIKKSIKKNRATANRAAKQAAMRAGEEYFDADGENLAKLIASKIAKMLSMATPEGAKETNILQSALTKFAKDKMGIKPIANPKIKDKNLRILQAIMASTELKTQFIDELESQLADKFIGSSTGSWEAHKQILDDMREAGWSDNIRDNAVKDIQNQLQVTIAKMIGNGWEGSKAEVLKVLKDRVGEIGSPEMLETLYDEVEQSLDDQAAEYLDKTFGYKRGEDGKIIATDKGRIAGAPGMAKVLKQWGVTLRDLTRQNIILRDQAIDANAKSFVAKMGLPEDMAYTVQEMIAQELKDAVEWTKESEIAKRVQVLMDKSSKKTEPNVTKNIIDKIVELGNQGFLDNPTIYEAIRQNYKNNDLPPFNKAVGEMVRQLGSDMAFMDDGLAKNEIRQAIANQLANMGGITWGELATSYWYFALLSGPSTQVVNATYNAFSTMGDALAMIADSSRKGQFKKSQLVLANLMRSISPNGIAAQRFLYTMQTGMAPNEISSKFGYGKDLGIKNVQHLAQLPFERITEEEVSKQTGILSKIFYKLMFKVARGFNVHNVEFSARNLSRFMMATDMFFRTASRDAALGYQGYGENYQTIFNANLTKAKQMAGEGASQAKINSIADELVMNEIGGTKEGQYAVARAEQIGLDTVAAGQQKGLIGALAKMIAAQSVNYPALRAVVPFTGIVAGVWNNSLNYTIWGAARYARAMRNPNSTWAIPDMNGNMVPDDLQLAKAAIGTLATTFLALLFADHDDDWEIYGTGPKDPSDRKAFFAQGKKPFHIRIGNTLINYQFLGQMSLPLGILGTFFDAQRDRKGEGLQFNAQAMAELGAGLMAGSAVTMINQSFLSSVANLGEAMFSNSPAEGVLRWSAGLASSPMPNIVRQITNDVWTEKYRSSEFMGQMAIGLGVTKNIGTEPSLNIYGDQLKRREMPVIGRLTSSLDSSVDVLTGILDLGLGLPVTRMELEGVPMTDRQQTQFVKMAGPKLKSEHARILPTLQRMVNDGDIDKAKELLSDTTSRVYRDARRQMVRQP